MSLHGVFHIGYVVPNMDRALKTWVRQGAGIIVAPTVDPVQNVRCALLSYLGGPAIELVAPMPEGPNPVAARLAKGGGLDHVCYFTDALDADIAKMEADGGLVVVPPCFATVFHRRLAFIMTRAGLLVELMTLTALDDDREDPIAELLTGRVSGKSLP